MENKLGGLWEERLNNQSFELIGTNKPGEGNGYHDRISSTTPFHIRRQDQEKEEGFNSSIYFRDLHNRIDPRLSLDSDKFSENLKIENCSDNYYKTFKKYITTGDRWYRHSILELMHQWSSLLAYQGRIFIEFVSWHDNKSGEFYAFELKNIDAKFIKSRGNDYVFSEPHIENHKISFYKKIKIPKSKCIVIEWPKELGGFKGYQKKRKAIANLGSKFDLKDTFNPSTSFVSDWKLHDQKFNKIVSDWGLTNPPEDVSFFYKQYTRFKLKKTSIYCVHQFISGIKQLLEILNNKLQEYATIEFSNQAYSMERFNRKFSTWSNGELSFKDSSDYLYKE